MLKTRVRVGTPAPKFEVMSHEGEVINSEDLLGEPYILWFYPKADETDMIAEGLAFASLYDTFEARGWGQIFGVSTDSVEVNRAFWEKYEFPFLLLCDVDKEITRAYDGCKPSRDATDFCAMSIPACVVISETGIIKQYEYPFDPRMGPRNLLSGLDSRRSPIVPRTPLYDDEVPKPKKGDAAPKEEVAKPAEEAVKPAE